jgi:hypothetical protein
MEAPKKVRPLVNATRYLLFRNLFGKSDADIIKGKKRFNTDVEGVPTKA